jgi:hypothetical protein
MEKRIQQQPLHRTSGHSEYGGPFRFQSPNKNSTSDDINLENETESGINSSGLEGAEE